MFSSILAFIQVLPSLIQMITSFVSWINKVSGNDAAGFIAKVGSSFDQLSQAKTQEDHANAAKSLADLLASMSK